MRTPLIVIFLLITFSLIVAPASGFTPQKGALAAESGQIFLPLILTPKKYVPRVNAPFFDGDIRFPETAIFWFGWVNLTDNYADVRVGYNAEELYIHVAVFDRRLWYDTEPSPADLAAWDAVSLFLNLTGNAGNTPGSSAYRFDAQLNSWEERENWQASYEGNGFQWMLNSIPFATTRGWRGNAPNDAVDDRGWTMTFQIPFSNLGLSGAPSEGTLWGLGLSLYDRDDASGTPVSVKIWPGDMEANRPQTWGQLRFGLPAFSPPVADFGGTVTIRQNLNNANVADASVGGHTTCGQPYNPQFFNGWGDANYAGYDQINIQNQADVADWPCFSKFYITFPLDALPPGKEILSANLRMHEFGSSGQGADPGPQPSLIQVLTVKDEWNESTITWNNAPLALENVSRSWIDPVDEFPGWPGVPWDWDVSRAVADAYEANHPLRLVLYEADAAQHSGKYFVSSDTGEWNAEARPMLRVQWGEP
jgi:hypothetical protein